MLIASITELCAADHGGDVDLIARWTANKTVQDVTRWMFSAGTTILAAYSGDDIAGVGGYLRDGRIVLNYVAPGFQRRGVSGALLARMEQALVDAGCTEAALTSTTTARDFYLSRGWQIAGPPEDDYGFPGHPMRKNLGPPL